MTEKKEVNMRKYFYNIWLMYSEWLILILGIILCVLGFVCILAYSEKNGEIVFATWLGLEMFGLFAITCAIEDIFDIREFWLKKDKVENNQNNCCPT